MPNSTENYAIIRALSIKTLGAGLLPHIWSTADTIVSRIANYRLKARGRCVVAVVPKFVSDCKCAVRYPACCRPVVKRQFVINSLN